MLSSHWPYFSESLEVLMLLLSIPLRSFRPVGVVSDLGLDGLTQAGSSWGQGIFSCPEALLYFDVIITTIRWLVGRLSPPWQAKHLETGPFTCHSAVLKAGTSNIVPTGLFV